MPTGYEVDTYRNIGRIAEAVERIADSMTQTRELAPNEVQDAFVRLLRDRGADLAADRLSLLDPDQAWENWFGPLADRIEEQMS